MNLKRIKLKDIFSPHKWKIVFISILRRYLQSQGEIPEITISNIEQYHYRILNCPQCVEEGSCIGCGCTVPDNMFVKQNTCHNGEWGGFKTEKEWKTYKKMFGVEFLLREKVI